MNSHATPPADHVRRNTKWKSQKAIFKINYQHVVESRLLPFFKAAISKTSSCSDAFPWVRWAVDFTEAVTYVTPSRTNADTCPLRPRCAREFETSICFVVFFRALEFTLQGEKCTEPVLTSPFLFFPSCDPPAGWAIFSFSNTARNHYILCAHIICHFLSFTAIIGIPDIFFRLISAVI